MKRIFLPILLMVVMFCQEVPVSGTSPSDPDAGSDDINTPEPQTLEATGRYPLIIYTKETPHILFLNEKEGAWRLIYAKGVGEGFVFDEIDGLVIPTEERPGFFVDEAEGVHLVVGNNYLFNESPLTADWQLTSFFTTLTQADIVVDSEGLVHIAAIADEDAHLIYFQLDHGVLTETHFDYIKGLLGNVSMALFGGAISISYIKELEDKLFYNYITNETGAWEEHHIGIPMSPEGNKVIYDASGGLHAGYLTRADLGWGNYRISLSHSTRTVDTWNREVIPADSRVFWNSAVVFNQNNNSFWVYWTWSLSEDWQTGVLQCAYFKGDMWHVKRVTADITEDYSVYVDPLDRLHLIYSQYEGSEIKYLVIPN